MTAERKVKLTVLNDLICPNCCIAQHELLSAIAYAQNVLKLDLNFEIEFLPFRLISTTCLNEDMPKVEKSVYFTKKLGEENFKALAAGVAKWSEEKGIPLGFSGVMSQSTRGHRLARKAYLMGGQKLQLPVLCALYKAHLGEGKNIEDYDLLAEIAESAGMMSKEEALEFIKSDELLKEVNQICDEAKAKGIKGVPMTWINGKWAISGGQSSEIFIQMFQKLATCPLNGPCEKLDAKIAETVSCDKADLISQPMKTIC